MVVLVIGKTKRWKDGTSTRVFGSKMPELTGARALFDSDGVHFEANQ
jgi:hypothetical protein